MMKALKVIKSLRYLFAAFLLLLGVMFLNPTSAKAASTYKIRINKQQNCITIYKIQEDGSYKPFKAMICSVGNATPLGTFGLKEKIRWHELEGPVYGQYCTRITQHILFHSVWYYRDEQPSTLSYTQFNRLGSTASHGCVRICVRDAKWIYENVPSGTPVTIYKSKNPGPLGKPSMVKLAGYSGWDPTDTTNPKNPWNKKKPTLSVTGGNLVFASAFDVMKNVKAKNTVGNDAKKLVETKIEYFVKGMKKYKKVKVVNTKKPGTFRVTYKLTDEIGRKVKKVVKYKVLTKVFVKSITLNRTKKTLTLGGTKELKTTQLKVKKVTPKTASIQTAVYVSSNENVAKVDEKGLVTAVGVGKATITATAADGSGVSTTCDITVRQLAKSATVAIDKAQIGVGETANVTTTVLPETTTNKKVSYTSSNPAVAVVDEAGKVTGVAAGTVEIIATGKDSSAVTAKVSITVVPVVSKSEPLTTTEYEAAIGVSEDTAKAVLPASINVFDTLGNVVSTTVTWTITNFASTEGTYAAVGTVKVPDGWVGTLPTINANIALK